MTSLTNRVAIVTGAGHADGMGFATALRLAQSGARVVISDRVASAAEEEALAQRAASLAEHGGESLALAVDVTRLDSIESCVKTVQTRFGSVDILFNNAGSPVGVGDFLQMGDEAWDTSYRVNLKGVADFCRTVLPVMIEAGGGSIINNASLAGLGAVPMMAAYTATKFAVVGLTKALATEFGARGVRVNAVCPGMIWTRMGRLEVEASRVPGESFDAARARLADSGQVPAARWGEAAEVAEAVAFLAGEGASYINGVALPVAGGMAPGL